MYSKSNAATASKPPRKRRVLHQLRIQTLEHLAYLLGSKSNELGAFESGLLAAGIGTVPCVAVGGVITLGIVALIAWIAPQLRALKFDPHTLEQQ